MCGSSIGRRFHAAPWCSAGPRLRRRCAFPLRHQAHQSYVGQVGAFIDLTVSGNWCASICSGETSWSFRSLALPICPALRDLSFVICHLSSVIGAMPSHHYSLTTVWTGNTGKGTSGYRDYERSYDVRIPEKPVLTGSSDPKFRGDPTRYNPEDLLVASLSACHMLWYLHLCSDQKIICTHYSDAAEGEMAIAANGVGRFTKVVLHPDIVITSEAGLKAAHELHERAHALCFIANSVNFPVEVSPTIRVGS
jgi:organic hydroperoxide reductase OsmC/OhrA